MLITFINHISHVNNILNGWVWGPFMIALIIFTGIMMSVRTHFFQFTRIRTIFNETLFAIFRKENVTKTKDQKAISQFQALSTALAATIGTGNIAGVATAIAIGGPGSVFWMWISALFGMMTIYAENVLGIYFRTKNKNGEWCGGPMYYLRDGLEHTICGKKVAKVLAILFAIFCIFASFGIGNMTQVNTIANAMQNGFGINSVVTGAVCAIVISVVILGGIKRIGKVTEKIVPFMALTYIIGALIVFFANYKQIPYVFISIFYDAFGLSAVGGGVCGYIIKRAMKMGFKRGIFSNEAGLGSTVIVNASCDVENPVTQGMWGIFEVFVDTIVVCTLTAFVLLSTMVNVPSEKMVFANLTTDFQDFSITNNSKPNKIPLIDTKTNFVPIEVNQNGNAKLYLPSQINCEFQNTKIKQNGNQNLEKEIRNQNNISYVQWKEEWIQENYIPVYSYDNLYYLKRLSEERAKSNDCLYTNVMRIKTTEMRDENGKIVYDERGNPMMQSVQLEQINGVSMVSYALREKFGSITTKLLAIEVLLFAFSTLLGWSYYGTKAIEFLFGEKLVVLYKCVFVVFIMIGATMSLNLVWDISDTLNGLMAIPNLIGILFLSKIVIQITKDYNSSKKQKK